MIRISAWRILAVAGLSYGVVFAAANAPGGESKATADRVVAQFESKPTSSAKSQA